jgi:hypothetical protein
LRLSPWTVASNQTLTRDDEIYTGDGGNDQPHSSDRLSEEDLDRVQKEFFNAIRSVNLSLVEDLISRKA